MTPASVMDSKNKVVRIFLDESFNRINLIKYKALYVEDYVYVVGKPEDIAMLRMEMKTSKPLTAQERYKLTKRYFDRW